MSQVSLKPVGKTERQYFIGGSDARIVMGNDEVALVRLWREKRGEVEPEDLSGNLIVQLGAVTEELNRRWYEVTYRSGRHRRAAARQTPSAAVDGSHPGRAN
jgi:predicted phage-related endonuclease